MWQGMVWQRMVWQSMVWQGMVWQSMVWQGITINCKESRGPTADVRVTQAALDKGWSARQSLASK